MTPTDHNPVHRATVPAIAKICLAALIGGAMLLLQGCVSDMPEPRYPVYMQDKPAEAVQTVQQAGDDRPVSPPAVIAQPNQGTVSTNDLPPPPPPPPPPAQKNIASSATPPVSTTAPVKDTRAAYVYVLQAHDTLYGVSRRFGVPVKVLYEINGLAPDASLRIGQKILLPDTAVDKGPEERASGPGMVRIDQALAKPTTTPPPPPPPAATKPAVTKPAVTPPSATPTKPAVAPPAAQPSTPVVKPAPAIAGFPTNAQLSQMGRGMFVWPVRGKILVPFGQLAPNVRNDGINIAAEEGVEVKASADGMVVYEGDQVKELGNTIYIKHANGWYTGYSHLSGMSVKNNERVTKGQVIGRVGQTGVIDRPQLHFEIRYTPSTDIARPIDPSLVLP